VTVAYFKVPSQHSRGDNDKNFENSQSHNGFGTPVKSLQRVLKRFSVEWVNGALSILVTEEAGVLPGL
jgi:hypothetical protein